MMRGSDCSVPVEVSLQVTINWIICHHTVLRYILSAVWAFVWVMTCVYSRVSTSECLNVDYLVIDFKDKILGKRQWFYFILTFL